MKKNLLILLLSLLFTACSTSSLKLNNNNELRLNYSDNTYLISKDIKYKKLLNFKDLSIEQYTVSSDNGAVLHYENIYTDTNYEFNFGGLFTVMYAFDDSRKYEIVYIRDNLNFAQIQLKDKNYINAIIQSNNNQEYSFLYGFSNEEFVKIAELIKLKDTKITKPKYKAITLDSSSKPLTNWNDLLVFFTPLITPLRYLGSN
ncbi:hypothetical protein [Sulfurimonas sp.]